MVRLVGAASAIAAPLIRDAVYADSPVLNYSDDKVRQAITVGLATLVGRGAGSLLGTDATSAALGAQNESLNNATSGAKPVLVPMPVPGGAVAFMPLPGSGGPEGTSTPNNGPQKADPLINPLEAANDGKVITTPNNGPQGSTLTGTPGSGPQGPTLLSNPGCMLFPAICAGLTAIAQIQDGTGGGAANIAVTSNGTANAATGARLADYLASGMSKPLVSDSKLGGLMDDLYRDGAKIGTGSTADAVRYETQTGNPVGGVLHTQKAKDYSAASQKWLETNPNASFSDRSAAHNVLKDLQNALNRK